MSYGEAGVSVTLRSNLAPLASLGLAIGLIASVRPGLAEEYSVVRAKSDSYALPPPEQTVLMSLGYRAALADFLYAHLRVSHGAHFAERRRFEHAGDYIDVINTLDPLFPEPYLYADTLLTVQPVEARPQDWDKAREIQLRGTEALPYHQQMWFVAGQFIGYIAPPNLQDPEKAKRWRLEGAKILARACELASDNDNIPYHCITAATLLNKAGEREALIQWLTRMVAVTDDEEIRERALATLGRWGDEKTEAEQQRRVEAFTKAWSQGLRFVPKHRMLLLGPPVDPFACSGQTQQYSSQSPDVASCDYSWKRWFERRF